MSQARKPSHRHVEKRLMRSVPQYEDDTPDRRVVREREQRQEPPVQAVPNSTPTQPRRRRPSPTADDSTPELVIRANRPAKRTSRRSPSPSDHGFSDQKEFALERLNKHYALCENTDLLLKALEKTVDGIVKATYEHGQRQPQVDESAVMPRIGLTFLAGADAPKVNQMEELQMSQAIPDQMDSSWRVTTAGTLLTDLCFDDKMMFKQTDVTPAVTANTRNRQLGLSVAPLDQTGTAQALATRRPGDGRVTISSEHVRLVRDLKDGRWDLEGMLVEVDGSSMHDLFWNYHKLIVRTGPDLPPAETVELLDTMIEDARRLFTRSPILFRMSTRQHIISSCNTRYGVDTGSMFQTIATSSAIRRVISMSSSYFNSLKQYREADQAKIRPRFLQMLVLLLSLVNDDDLRSLAAFLEKTYRIPSERQHLELLILKVLPLSSINSSIFLAALVAAVERPLANQASTPGEQRVLWDRFIRVLLGLDYILPGTIDQLGRSECSWIVSWPGEEGFSDSNVFRNLQYGGPLRAINEIPPFSLSSEFESKEVTVTLENGLRYVISSADLDNVTRMTPGKYSVAQVAEGGRSFDLNIDDTRLNQALFPAIAEVNSTLAYVKHIIKVVEQTIPKREIVRKFLYGLRSSSSRPDTPKLEEILPSELKSAGRLTCHVATLNGHMLAVAYKVDGRKITKRQLLQHLASDIGEILANVNAIEATIQEALEGKHVHDDIKRSVNRLPSTLNLVRNWVRDAEEKKTRVEKYSPQLRDEPVSKVLYPMGDNEVPVTKWNDYKVWYVSGENKVCMEAQRRKIEHVIWADEVIEVTFAGQAVRYFVKPLRALQEHEKEEELRVNDNVLLLGGYLLVVEASDQSYEPIVNGNGHPQSYDRRPPWVQQGNRQRPLEAVVNWLKVTGIEAAAEQRRGKNRQQGSLPSLTEIR